VGAGQHLPGRGNGPTQGQSEAHHELTAELKTQNLKPETITCIGARFGGNWTNLGGARAIPFNCQIGPRTIDINGDLKVYDAAGKELDMDADDTPAQAASYKQLNVTWQWS